MLHNLLIEDKLYQFFNFFFMIEDMFGQASLRDIPRRKRRHIKGVFLAYLSSSSNGHELSLIHIIVKLQITRYCTPTTINFHQ